MCPKIVWEVNVNHVCLFFCLSVCLPVSVLCMCIQMECLVDFLRWLFCVRTSEVSTMLWKQFFNKLHLKPLTRLVGCSTKRVFDCVDNVYSSIHELYNK